MLCTASKWLITLIIFALSACSKAKGPDTDPPVTPVEKSLRAQYEASSSLWPKPVLDEGITLRELALMPAGSVDPVAQRKILALGKVLLFDPRVGRGDNSCSSCHNPATYWVDRKKTAEGIATHHRNTPSMENVWYVNGRLFHDGRAKTYAEQIAEAIESPIEMGGNTYTLPAKLSAVDGYLSLFAEAYGDQEINRQRILNAIAVYSQSIVSGETAFDRFLKGQYTALSDQQIEGLHLFRTKGRCLNCHNGPFLTDLEYHNLGYAKDHTGALDNGRFIATGKESDKGRFRTAGLRNVAQTYPYMHNGSVGTLDEMLDLLGQGMPQTNGQQVNGELSPHIKNLRLTSTERKAIISFLESLSSEQSPTERPVIPQ
ncbi:cytochrome c peroxidase [Sphingobacterium spiritivorum]|uniref:Di-heme cytochrome C peroxidase n=2 Tax=Sphingobacterium spiritivorum TaxID=258 RepID=D7VRP9_SPHSI|nr:cytochrome c peroxidase [Sphingobacterium spiritivorum]EFK56450.1 di-heme cytochrome C peroxidase [Sphingobacterium spiritivorum ATCC 33861]QQT35480.1 cytochrome-c peroxidase [Sphingobacterium spiritivorum]WQD32170.1 cytochrome c peroxidase [Sphingobacterium spiritivorum]SUJ06127.1 Cytochrome c551 peroxidase precursor [Sphingobacterium spiritivorum]